MAERATAAEAARWTALAAYQLRQAGQTVAAAAAQRVAAAEVAKAEGTTLAAKEAEALVKATSGLAASVQAGLVAQAARYNALAEQQFKEVARTASEGVKSVIEEAAKVQKEATMAVTKEAEKIVVNVSVENKGAVDTILGALRGVGEGIVAAFAELGRLELEFMRAVFVEGIGATIAEGFARAIEQQMGMPFAQGVPIAEDMAAKASEVVKRGSPEVRAGYERAIESVQRELVEAIDRTIAELEARHSPITPEEAFKSATAMSGVGLGVYVGLAAASSAIEAATLGQVEIPGHFMRDLAALYGLYKFVGTPVITAYDVGVATGLRYYYNRRFTPVVPSIEWILDMYSRAKLSPDVAHALARYHGLGPEYDAFLDELKNTPLRYFALNAISRAGLFDEAVFKEELDRCGYSERAKELLMKAFRIGEMTAEVREGFGALRKLLKEGFRTEEEALAMWEEFRAAADPIARQLIVARWEYEYDFKSDLRALILEQFERGLLDRARAFSALSEIMPIAARVNTLLDRAELKIKVEKVPEPKEKVLTKSEILSAFKNEIITLEEAVARLRAMRYADEDIEILIALNMPKPKKR